MSVNLNPGLFAQNFQVKNNAVKQAPAAGLTTPLAGDTVSFKKAQNKLGFKCVAESLARHMANPTEETAEVFLRDIGRSARMGELREKTSILRKISNAAEAGDDFFASLADHLRNNFKIAI